MKWGFGVTGADRSCRETRIWRSGIWRLGRDFMIGFAVFCGLAGLFILDGEGSMHAEGLSVAVQTVRVRADAGPEAGKIGITKAVDQVIAETHAANAADRVVATSPVLAGTTAPPAARPYVALLILATVFSALVAFNLAFFRHLKRRYSWRQHGVHTSVWRG
ncbi:MAG: hypothetical protein AAFV45_09750 [Pseudomonadota bacterium]